ncbi:hypothetical protein GCM10010206_16540 [Streptomyces cinerochromogenes]|nr:hypothetical protein GCM10010206_16540 [Streptomyces cinerochromogenes]
MRECAKSLIFSEGARLRGKSTPRDLEPIQEVLPMSDSNAELTPADLTAFDLLLSVMQDENESSINLRDFALGGTIDRYRAARDAIRRIRALRDCARQIRDVPREEELDIDSLTLGQLNIELSLDELLEMRRRVQPGQ